MAATLSDTTKYVSVSRGVPASFYARHDDDQESRRTSLNVKYFDDDLVSANGGLPTSTFHEKKGG